MRRPPDRVTAARMADVPIERDSIGAMAVAAGVLAPYRHGAFKPYVYRGTGVDIYENVVPLPAPKPKRKPKRKPKPKPRPTPRPRYYPPPAPAPEPVPEQQEKFPKVVPEVERPPIPVRPAKGWEPMSGAELEALLSEE